MASTIGATFREGLHQDEEYWTGEVAPNEDLGDETGDGESAAIKITPTETGGVIIALDVHGAGIRRFHLGMNRVQLEQALSALSEFLSDHGAQRVVDYAHARNDGLEIVRAHFQAVLDYGPARGPSAPPPGALAMQSVADILREAFLAILDAHPADDRRPALSIVVEDPFYLPFEALDLGRTDDHGALTLGDIASIHRMAPLAGERCARANPSVAPIRIRAEHPLEIFLVGAENSSHTLAEAGAIDALAPKVTLDPASQSATFGRERFLDHASAYMRRGGPLLYVLGHNAPGAYGVGFSLHTGPFAISLADFVEICRRKSASAPWPLTILSTCKGNSPHAACIGAAVALLGVDATGVIAATHDLNDRVAARIGPAVIRELLRHPTLRSQRADVSIALYRVRRRARTDPTLGEARARLMTDAFMTLSRDMRIEFEWWVPDSEAAMPTLKGHPVHPIGLWQVCVTGNDFSPPLNLEHV